MSTSLDEISMRIGALQEQGANAERSRGYIKEELAQMNARLTQIEYTLSARAGQGDELDDHDGRIRMLETDLNQRIGKAKAIGVAAGFGSAVGMAGFIEAVKHFFLNR